MRIEPFTYLANPGRVIFGEGSLARLPEEIDRLDVDRVLVLSTPQQRGEAEALADRLGSRASGIFAGARMHTPVEVTQQALRKVEELGVRGIVALGGGSTIGLSKAIALRTDLPQLVVPTTYAGSEVTPILGETSEGVKKTLSSPRVLPEVVIYDVDLTLTLPPGLSGTSGMNAIAHAVEALYAREGNPIISLLAVEGIGALAGALPAIMRDPADKAARGSALYGAWLCGICLGSVGMALHHKLCHVLGGSFDLPHADTHGIVLPHALAYNAPAVPDALRRLRPVLGPDPVQALFDLLGSIGAPAALRDLGMPQDGIEQAVELALANPYWNPRSLEAEPIRRLIGDAWAGRRPAQSDGGP